MEKAQWELVSEINAACAAGDKAIQKAECHPAPYFDKNFLIVARLRLKEASMCATRAAFKDAPPYKA